MQNETGTAIWECALPQRAVLALLRTANHPMAAQLGSTLSEWVNVEAPTRFITAASRGWTYRVGGKRWVSSPKEGGTGRCRSPHSDVPAAPMMPNINLECPRNGTLGNLHPLECLHTGGGRSVVTQHRRQPTTARVGSRPRPVTRPKERNCDAGMHPMGRERWSCRLLPTRLTGPPMLSRHSLTTGGS